MARMTGGEAVAAALMAEGVEHLFGIVGTHNAPVFDGAYHADALRVVTARGGEFDNGDKLGTRSIIRLSDAYEARLEIVEGE